MNYTGGCHCGKVRFEVEGVLSAVMDCDCSICRKAGFLHWIVDEQQVRFVEGYEMLKDYVWGTGAAHHYFCGACGVAPLRRPRLKPDGYSVNVRCLDGVDLNHLAIERYAGSALQLYEATNGT